MNFVSRSLDVNQTGVEPRLGPSKRRRCSPLEARQRANRSGRHFPTPPRPQVVERVDQPLRTKPRAHRSCATDSRDGASRRTSD